ncbi:hypothetical protein [Vibrio sp. 10N.261.51.F12]|uniref:hypothetical protein n=1 Tax=Vibrio sp. 10N.261.51.F12 TaxID=3229679 RepID=UPI00354B920A
MKRIYCLASILLLFTQQAYALTHSDAKPGSTEFLISACHEYTELYKKKDEPRFGAFVTTSKEESFRAGYCLGAIMNASNICGYSTSVYWSAERIASVSNARAYSEAKLLDRVVCR